MQAERSTSQMELTPKSVDELNFIVAEVIALGDKLYFEASKLHEKARHRAVVFFAAILLGLVVVFVWKKVIDSIPELLLLGLVSWLVYLLIERFFLLFRADEKPVAVLHALKTSLFFAATPTYLQRELQVFLKLAELLNSTATALHANGAISELRWQTVKLHLSRYGI
jgi:hypothetical protein